MLVEGIDGLRWRYASRFSSFWGGVTLYPFDSALLLLQVLFPPMVATDPEVLILALLLTLEKDFLPSCTLLSLNFNIGPVLLHTLFSKLVK